MADETYLDKLTSGKTPHGEEVLKLDLHDPFDEALFRIHQISQAKRRDYASFDDRFSNFSFTAEYFGFRDYQSADFLELVKLARLRQLNHPSVMPSNEPVEDSYLDKATYAVLAFAMYIRAQREHE